MKKKKVIYQFLNDNEIEIGWRGKRPPGEKRSDRKKPTKEEMKKQNQRNRVKALRRKIKANFFENDYWVTLTYRKENRKSVDGARGDMGRFLRKLRGWYRKMGEQLKFIYRIEVGKRGAVHVHFLVNRIPGCDMEIKGLWQQGRPMFKFTYEEGGFADLAEYIAKEPEGEGVEIRYSASRNLVIPQPEEKEYKRLNTEEPRPTKGYYIDRDTIVRGVNPYTGHSYLHYTERRIRKRKGKEGEGYVPGQYLH